VKDKALDLIPPMTGFRGGWGLTKGIFVIILTGKIKQPDMDQ
jgi:hypothetical protein